MGRSRLWYDPAKGLEVNLRRLWPASNSGFKCVDGSAVFGRVLEVEHRKVFRDASRIDRLRDHVAALLQVPAQHDLRRATVVTIGNSQDRSIRQSASFATAVESDATDR